MRFFSLALGTFNPMGIAVVFHRQIPPFLFVTNFKHLLWTYLNTRGPIFDLLVIPEDVIS